MRALVAAVAATLLVASSAHGQDPATVAKTGPPSTVQTNRDKERPYRNPADMQTGVPGRPIRLDPLEAPYLWAVDAGGRFLVAPENATDRERLLKHGDLTPSADGAMRGAARIAGLLRWDPKAQSWLMDADSSYNYNRTDGVRHLSAENLDAAFALLADTGTDVSHVKLDYKFLIKPGESARASSGVLGELTRAWIFTRIAVERVLAKVGSWLDGAPARSDARPDDRGFERPAASEGLTRILDRAASADETATDR